MSYNAKARIGEDSVTPGVYRSECYGVNTVSMKGMLQTHNKDEQWDNDEVNIPKKRVAVNWAEAQFFEVRLRPTREGRPSAKVTRGQVSCN